MAKSEQQEIDDLKLESLLAEIVPDEKPKASPTPAAFKIPVPFPTQIPRTSDARQIVEHMFCNMRAYSQTDLTVIAMARYDIGKTGKISSSILRSLGKIEKAWSYKDAQPTNALSVERGTPKVTQSNE